ncbi:ribbon-helix-helix protein, CopG family [Allochromatium humboldtianum]|uniref:Ribbon-helix-helix protein, CopG family n=1 Tax=Allochromatium humboldtianum TaxID=504901 RepID=A0A850R9G1_9GAMM|nr:ribbon-helix-helix protein, CopG family [Allochromatium humboldtianum]NVZ10564.1 ribbon-helix-helix protein, CopG family [Allochromatium humboldtianum]
MPARKTETLTIRLCPETKAALRQAAERERRSLSNMLEIMIRDYPGLDALQRAPNRVEAQIPHCGDQPL